MLKVIFSFFTKMFSFHYFSIHKTIDIDPLMTEKEIFDDLTH